MATTVIWWWSAQLALNLTWSAVFFGLHRPLWALITTRRLTSPSSPASSSAGKYGVAASVLLVPYLAWTSFAAALNFAIVSSN